MRRILLLLFIGFALSLTSCRNDFEFERSTGGLEFSKDTVYLDTVFTNIGSSTYTLKVYNRSDKDIKIPSIRLGEGEASKYRLMVDGMPGKVFNDVELLAKDSMFVFIETTINYQDYANNTTTFLYNDKIFFDTGANEQKVELVTLVQDAIFIKPDRPLPTDAKELLTINGMASDILGHKLQTPDELHWTNAKPYVVYGYAQVPNGSTLNIDPGARVHFHADSGIIVDNNGILKINGLPSTDADLLENEVIFEGDRLEPGFEDAPGQWGTILVMSGNANTIRHLTLKNAAVGIIVQRVEPEAPTLPRLDINDSQIYNCSNVGLLGRGAVINGDNLVMNNAGESALACTFGGLYRFRHCTFANYSNNFNQRPVVVTDFLRTETATYVSAVDVRFDNCILYGSSNYGIYFQKESGDDVTFKTILNHCLIKFSDFSNQYAGNAFYKFDASTEADPVFYTQCIRANNSTVHNPKFFDPGNNDLRILKDDAAPGSAENTADAAVAAQIPFDIANESRLIPADIGAYESQVAPED